ncbi:hypothetical protein [Streptomyces caeruleatus]|uniref:Uncharacterized protein n=1 Tax=Streptomyces caeruleatus TaxID=661399 RepID=A0A101TDT5_9ACTN|nr:hypothetical protein [Streptomyces caeruleatus]KUN90424.1 hypothetical protein AQJ67_44095 [Streptomyces caeruleatus]
MPGRDGVKTLRAVWMGPIRRRSRVIGPPGGGTGGIRMHWKEDQGWFYALIGMSPQHVLLYSVLPTFRTIFPPPPDVADVAEHLVRLRRCPKSSTVQKGSRRSAPAGGEVAVQPDEASRRASRQVVKPVTRPLRAAAPPIKRKRCTSPTPPRGPSADRRLDSPPRLGVHVPQTARRAPDTTAAREALHRALRLLDDQDNPDALAEARAAAQAAAQAAADAVPYPWRATHCTANRRNAKEDTCHSSTCTRCTAFRAGDPMPFDDY